MRKALINIFTDYSDIIGNQITVYQGGHTTIGINIGELCTPALLININNININNN